jgi:hypothetical protein
VVAVVSIDEVVTELVFVVKRIRKQRSKRSRYQRRYYKTRKKIARCVRCIASAEPGKVMCEAHLVARHKKTEPDPEGA